MQRWLGLAALVLVALALRLPHLDATGLSEDEMDKLHAADAYDHGTFAVDGEHPALMKLAIYGSLKLSSTWNVRAPARLHISTEASVRAPNAIAGALVTLVLFLLAEGFFGTLAGVIAAWLWAFDVGAIAINRIAKEDTFALLFLLVAALLYERGKRAGATDARRAQRWFAAAGAAFGLMLASKYVPYLFGIHAIYFRLADPEPGANRPDKPLYFGALAAAFAVANFPILAIGNWTTILAFVQGHAIAHSGYLFQGQLWANRLSASPWGLPIWFYGAQLLTKVPVVILLAAGIGAVRLVRTRATRGSLFVLVFLVLTFAPLSLVATKFLRYMLPALAMIDLAAAAGIAWLLAAAWRSIPVARAAAWGAAASARVARAPGRVAPASARVAAASVLVAVLVGVVAASIDARPFEGLYRNVIGRTLSPKTLWFPPDELYDAGLREATARLVRDAAPGARIVTEAPSVVGFYAAQAGRSDLVVVRPESLDSRASGVQNALAPTEWLIVQEGRRYFENDALIRQARLAAPAFSIDVDGFRAVDVYRTSARGTPCPPASASPVPPPRTPAALCAAVPVLR